MGHVCSDILGPYPDRKSSDKRPATIPHLNDIMEGGIANLDTMDKLPDVVARNLDRVPSFSMVY